MHCHRYIIKSKPFYIWIFFPLITSGFTASLVVNFHGSGKERRGKSLRVIISYAAQHLHLWSGHSVLYSLTHSQITINPKGYLQFIGGETKSTLQPPNMLSYKWPLPSDGNVDLTTEPGLPIYIPYSSKMNFSLRDCVFVSAHWFQ